ncbi:hypothetical protein [Paraburkholderia caribensis]|uniref:hypothetical protein n=1 Tax=Paraburkholderia caribensis TaxID=75105 RepID=UPI001CB1198F|nr:hypothetical protein [Paraburkholderia caribensis]CAG9263220.1 hypothetical protein PCAR4_570282 [Paraburkholderia caribensis]
MTQSGSSRYSERRLGRYLFLVNNSPKLFRAMDDLAQLEQPVSQGNALTIEYLHQVLAKLFPHWDNAELHGTGADAALLMQTFHDLHYTSRRGGILPSMAKRHRVANLSPALKLAREHAESHPDTCFLVRSSELPNTMRELVSEQYYVVVPLAAQFDESWIYHPSATNVCFDPLVFTDSPSFNDIRMMLTVKHGVMFDYEALKESVFRRFRAELPVVYISRASSTLITYPFQPF